MSAWWETAENALWNLLNRLSLVGIIDIIIVAVIIYEVLRLTRQTRGGAVLKGVVLFLLAWAASSMLGLTSVHWLLNQLATNGVIVLIILFQPELRKVLEQVGRSAAFSHKRHKEDNTERERIIGEIILTMKNLSRRRVGALMVFERKTGLQDFIETGTALNSRISAPLLENVFEPNTPLHDGAVIIRGTEVMAAACILPLTESRDVNRELGTRHRAGIGISETTDALVLIVSEETGTMSVAEGGRITRPVSERDLRRLLEGLYAAPTNVLNAFLRRMATEEEEKA